MSYVYIISALSIFICCSIQPAQNTNQIRVTFNSGGIASFRLPTNNTILNHVGIQPELINFAAQTGVLREPFFINVPENTSYQEIENIIRRQLQATVEPFIMHSTPVIPGNIVLEPVQPTYVLSGRSQNYVLPQETNQNVIPVQPAGPPLPNPFVYEPLQTPNRHAKCCSCSCTINFLR